MRWGVLLMNLGTPDAPRVPEVRRYLRQFLSDPRVIDIPAPRRRLLVEAFILPFRPRASAKAYRAIWTDEGSPLLVHGRALAAKLAARLDGVPVELGMRYGRPPIGDALRRLLHAGVDGVVALPLFPQYASSSTGSALEALYRDAARLWNVPPLQVVPPFWDHPAFLDACAAAAAPVLEDLRPDRVLLSFHGLPERQVRKSDASPGGTHCLAHPDCCARIVPANQHCYRAQCFATARGIAERLDLPEDRWLVAFQSRLGREPWIRPYTDEEILRWAREGVRRVAVLSPSFVADCLETLEEIAIRAREDFRAAGGEELRLVPSLNARDDWTEALVRILEERSPLGLRRAGVS